MIVSQQGDILWNNNDLELLKQKQNNIGEKYGK